LDDPSRFKHYEILSRLGEGGMGVVYRARDTRLGRVVALKMLHGDPGRDEERSRRFEREARIVSSLSHPGIATLYDYDREGDTAFLAMELVEGSSLRKLLEEGPLSVDQLLDFGVQVTEALAAAHKAGVIHRDLKPENIMLASSGYYKVLDFGVARVDLAQPSVIDTQSETQTWATRMGGVIGTVAYMSPEQAMAEAVDARSDIFSFGSLLYELAGGSPAFRGNNDLATANAIVHGEPEPLREVRPDTPLGLQLVIEKCLAKKPEERYQTAEALATDLRTLRLHSLTGSSGLRKLLAHRDSPTRRRRRRAAGLLLAAGLTGALVAGWWITRPDRVAQGPTPPPAKPVAPRGASLLAVSPGDTPRVVVAYFENRSGDPEADWLSEGLPEMLTTDLSHSEDVEVIATQRLDDLVATLGDGAAATIDRTSAAQLARWAGASLVISGSVFKLGETYRIDAQVSETDTGTIVTAQKVEGDDLFALVNELTAELLDGLALTGVRPDELPTGTDSEEAFRLFAAGTELYDDLRYEQAIERLQGAVETDPDFATARLRLALSLHAAGDRDAATQHFRALREQHDRLRPRERMLVEAYDRLFTQHDVEAGLGRLDEIVRQFPSDGTAYVLWAEALDEMAQDPFEATAKLREAIVLDPNNLPAVAALADQLARLGELNGARQLLEQAAQRNPRSAAPLMERVEAMRAAPENE
jgi:TolB-like protein/predicted Ser/Thr protein kinase